MPSSGMNNRSIQRVDLFRRLLAAERAMALTEFALFLPIMIMVGGYGVEIAYFSVCNLRVGQAALNLADNASRIGADVTQDLTTVTQLRESDINDVFRGLQSSTSGLDIAKNGRVTLSSVEYVKLTGDNNVEKMRIHWQRCLGVKTGAGWDSSYTGVPYNSGTDDSGNTNGKELDKPYSGVGDQPIKTGDPALTKVKPPLGGGLMYVEINYQYSPLFGRMYAGRSFMPSNRIHYVASFLVRDNRVFTKLFNTDNQPVMSCDKTPNKVPDINRG